MRGACDLVEIVLDLPTPISTNKIWRTGRGRTYRSKEYVAWCEWADLTVMAAKQYPKRKINGPFEVEILLSTVGRQGPRWGQFLQGNARLAALPRPHSQRYRLPLRLVEVGVTGGAPKG